MILSDHIASLIEEMLKEGGGSAEVKRNDLAAKIGCVPEPDKLCDNGARSQNSDGVNVGCVS